MTSFHIFGSLIKFNPCNVRLLVTRIMHLSLLCNKIGNVRKRRQIAHIQPKVTIHFVLTHYVVTFSKCKIAIYEESPCIITVYDGQKRLLFFKVYMNCKKWHVDIIDIFRTVCCIRF